MWPLFAVKKGQRRLSSYGGRSGWGDAENMSWTQYIDINSAPLWLSFLSLVTLDHIQSLEGSFLLLAIVNISEHI